MAHESKRLHKELREISNDPKSGVSARVKDEKDMSKLEGTISGKGGALFVLGLPKGDVAPLLRDSAGVS